MDRHVVPGRIAGYAVLTFFLAACASPRAPSTPGQNEYDRGIEHLAAGRHAEAIPLLRRSAELGHPSAQRSVGDWSRTGIFGIRESITEAIHWYRLAAAQGDADAQYALGSLYESGTGVPRVREEALKWYRLAADRGHVGAQYMLGMKYWLSYSDARLKARFESAQQKPKGSDLAEAVKWLMLAANQGHPFAQAEVGEMHSSGTGLPKDLIQAHMWLNLALSRSWPSSAQSSEEFVTRSRTELESKMTPEELDRAQRLAADWEAEGTAGGRRPPSSASAPGALRLDCTNHHPSSEARGPAEHQQA